MFNVLMNLFSGWGKSGRAFPERELPHTYKEGILRGSEEAVLMEFPNGYVESAWTLSEGIYSTQDDPDGIGKRYGFDKKFPDINRRFGDMVVYGYVIKGIIYVSDVYSKTRGAYFDFDDAFHIALRELRVEILPTLYRGMTLDSISFIKQYFVPSRFNKDKMPEAILIRPVQERNDPVVGRINLLMPTGSAAGVSDAGGSGSAAGGNGGIAGVT